MSEQNNKTSEDAFKIIDSTEIVEIDLDEGPNKKNTLKEILSYIILIAIAFALAQIIHRYVFTPVTVDGESMEETLHNNDYLFLWRLGEIKRFDVVVFDYKGDMVVDNVTSLKNDDKLIKRLIGLPGDVVEVKNNILYINGKAQDQAFLDSREITSDFTLGEICQKRTDTNCMVNDKLMIPKGYYLVLGDNRDNSTDSRRIGLVSEEQIMGKATYILYPFNRFGKIE